MPSPPMQEEEAVYNFTCIFRSGDGPQYGMLAAPLGSGIDGCIVAAGLVAMVAGGDAGRGDDFGSSEVPRFQPANSIFSCDVASRSVEGRSPGVVAIAANRVLV